MDVGLGRYSDSSASGAIRQPQGATTPSVGPRTVIEATDEPQDGQSGTDDIDGESSAARVSFTSTGTTHR